MTIDGDPELTELANAANAKLSEEIDEAQEDQPTPMDLSLEAKATRESADMLSDIEEFTDEELEIKPAETLNEFAQAIAQAHASGKRQIFASKKVIFHHTKPNYPQHHFFDYQGVRVIEVGQEDYVKKFFNQSIEEKLFGRSSSNG